MITRFIREQIFSAKVDPERWLVLMKKGLHDWNLRVIGPEPLDVDFADMSASQAQERSLSMATEHFKAVNPKVLTYRIQQWRLALSWDRVSGLETLSTSDGFLPLSDTTDLMER